MTIQVQPRLEVGAPVLAAENVRGYDVRGTDNDSLGRVDDLITASDSRRVRFLKVGDGGFFGIGRSHRLVPVDVVSGVSGEYVFLNVDRDQFQSAPTWRPLEDPSYVTEVVRHFGTQPFWAADYQAPDWTSPD